MKFDSKTIYFGVVFFKASLNIYVCFYIEFKVVYIFNFFLFLKLYVFVGCIKNNYIDVYLFDKDVLRFVKRSFFFFVNIVILFVMRFF